MRRPFFSEKMSLSQLPIQLKTKWKRRDYQGKKCKKPLRKAIIDQLERQKVFLMRFRVFLVSNIYGKPFVPQTRSGNEKPRQRLGFSGAYFFWCTILVAAMWLEHMTLRVWTECSSQLSYAAILFCRPHPEWDTGENGCGGGTWTPDLRVMSPTSYRLLYPATLRKDYNSTGRALSQVASLNFFALFRWRQYILHKQEKKDRGFAQIGYCEFVKANNI